MLALCAALVFATTQLGTASAPLPDAPGTVLPTLIAPPPIARTTPAIATRTEARTVSREQSAPPQVARTVVTVRVTDQDNAVVPGASVDLVRIDPTPGMTTYGVTDSKGRFTFERVPAGRYRLTVRLTGFKTAIVDLPVVDGRPVDLGMRLDVGTLTEVVNVRHLSNGATVPAPQTVAPESPLQLLDAARIAYAQRRYADAEQLTARALALMRSGAMTPIGPMPAPSLITRESTPQAPVRVGGEIQPPKKIRDVPPVYPEIAAAAGVQGIVYIEAVVGTDGTVQSARVLKGVALLDDAALAAVRQWRYTPTLLNGQPIEIIMTVTVNFKLGG
jgi:TonB family protein